MSFYEKGARFERSLVHKFQENGWISFRAAGSGTIKYIIPDIIAIKEDKVLMVECKSTKKRSISLKETMLNLKKILPISKFDIYIAVKFNRQEPRFYNVKNLLKKKNYTISLKDEYIEFLDVITKNHQKSEIKL